MLNIVVINCNDNYVEYEWSSLKDFVSDIDSENENIPMLDDTLVEVNTDNERLNSWWRDTCYDTVNDLYEMCRQNF